MFTLKSITADGIPAALERAERYRLLNDPVAAESICLDVLEIDPENQRALVALLLARSDQFSSPHGAGVAQAREVLPRLSGAYDRAYYAGLIAERRGRALLDAHGPGQAQMAWHSLREGMELYEAAERIRPPGNDDVLLRWNTCARLLNAHPNLEPRAEEEYQAVLGD